MHLIKLIIAFFALLLMWYSTDMTSIEACIAPSFEIKKESDSGELGRSVITGHGIYPCVFRAVISHSV